MTDEDLEQVWLIQTVDTDGKPVQLFVGQVTRDGKRVPVVRVDNGRGALVPLEHVGRLLQAIRETSLKTHVQNLRSEP